MPIAERMKLAEGRPLRRRMMAAMAQQDCGQCGYNCDDYADAIFEKAEERLNLCVPGGKETARMLKSLFEEIGERARPDASLRREASVAAPLVGDAGPFARQSGDGDLSSARDALNKRGLGERHLAYRVRSQRSPGSTMWWAMPSASSRRTIRRSSMRSSRRSARRRIYRIGGAPLRDMLIDDVSLVARARLAVPAVLLHHRRRAAAEGARRLPRGEDPDGDAATLDVLAALEKFAGVRPDPEAFVECARAAAAAALFDLVVARRTARPAVADGRYRALRHRRAQCASASPRPFSPTASRRARRSRSMSRRPMPSPCPPILRCRSSWSGPAPAWRRSAPSCRNAWRPRRPGRNWLFFGHQRRDCDFFYETNSNGDEGQRAC